MQKRHLLMAVLVVGMVGGLLTAGAPAQRAEGDTQLVTLRVPKMDCGGCEIAVRMVANRIKGVTKVETSSDTRTVRVTYDAEQTTPEEIAAAITEGTGFETEMPADDGSKS